MNASAQEPATGKPLESGLTAPAAAADGGTRTEQIPLFWTYGLLLAAVILFTGASAFGIYKLRHESEIAQTSSQATVWLVVSFEREYLILDQLLRRYEFGDPKLDADSLLTQFDVLWSRIELMQQGENARPLRQVESYHDVVPTTLGLLQRHENGLFEAVQARQPLPPDFLAEYYDLTSAIHGFMIDVHLNRSWTVDVREAQIKDTRLAIYLTLGATLTSSLILFVIVILQIRSRQKNLLRTLDALAQSKRDSNALREEVIYREKIEQERAKLLTDLEARNEELERYAYTISHDLKSPLYTIQGFTGFLERDLEKGQTANMPRDLGKIREAVQTMSNLLDDILSLSKVNLVQEAVQPVSLVDSVKNAMSSVSREINERGVIVNYETDLPVVTGEPQRLTEVFQNLISNAAKFMGEQKNPRIEIGASVDADWVRCYVRDNGIGIAEEYRERIFNLFERLDTHTQGTGIGLAIVKRIIDRHGGRIWIESSGIGSGTQFNFTLPRASQAT